MLSTLKIRVKILAFWSLFWLSSIFFNLWRLEFPNITGSFTIQIDDGKEEHTGVFNEVSKSNSQGYNRTGSIPGWDKFNFDANANKSIYKDNTNTVQPAANHVLIIIKT